MVTANLQDLLTHGLLQEVNRQFFHPLSYELCLKIQGGRSWLELLEEPNLDAGGIMFAEGERESKEFKDNIVLVAKRRATILLSRTCGTLGVETESPESLNGAYHYLVLKAQDAPHVVCLGPGAYGEAFDVPTGFIGNYIRVGFGGMGAPVYLHSEFRDKPGAFVGRSTTVPIVPTGPGPGPTGPETAVAQAIATLTTLAWRVSRREVSRQAVAPNSPPGIVIAPEEELLSQRCQDTLNAAGFTRQEIRAQVERRLTMADTAVQETNNFLVQSDAVSATMRRATQESREVISEGESLDFLGRAWRLASGRDANAVSQIDLTDLATREAGRRRTIPIDTEHQGPYPPPAGEPVSD